jgi:hypothetical protein
MIRVALNALDAIMAEDGRKYKVLTLHSEPPNEVNQKETFCARIVRAIKNTV